MHICSLSPAFLMLSSLPLNEGHFLSMSFPFQQQYMDYSNPTTPGAYPWDVDDPTAHGSASISPEALQQPMQLHQVHPQPAPEPSEHARHQPTPTSAGYQAPPTIELQERVPPSQFRFDNIDESHFQQIQENPPRSSTRSSSRRPSALRVTVDEARPSTSSSLGPSRATRQRAHVSHPYRHSSDGAGPSSAGGLRSQTASRRGREGESSSEARHGDIHERQSRLGVGSDTSLVGLIMPMAGTGEGTSTASCPAMHTWRVNSQTPSAQMQPRSASGGGVSAHDAATRYAASPLTDSLRGGLHVPTVSFSSGVSPEVTSPAPPTPGSIHTPAAPAHTPQLSTMGDFASSVPQVIGASSMPPPAAIHRPTEPIKRYNIRTDVHYNVSTNQMTAMFELPGLKKSDLKIHMSVCPYSRVRQVTISGESRPPLFADPGYTVKERKYGAFSRTVVVPHETQVRRTLYDTCTCSITLYVAGRRY